MASGNFGGGVGSSASPFIIEDILDLNAMRNRSEHFELAHDIEMDVWPFNAWEGWKPIENFTGTLDGKRHKIKNLFINRPSENYVGLFSNLTNPFFRDLSLENVSITGKHYVGALSGRLYYTTPRTIHRCSASGRVHGYSYVGGIVGYLYGYYMQMYDCISHCEVTGTSTVGGIGGQIYGVNGNDLRLYRCIFDGVAVAENGADGGITSSYHSSYSEFYDCCYLEGNKGIGSSFTREEMGNLLFYMPGFSRGMDGDKKIWFMSPPELPRLAHDVMPEEPLALIGKSDGYYTLEESLWVNLGQDLESIDMSRGLPWASLNNHQWWKGLAEEGDIEIVVISKVDNPYLSVIKVISEAEAITEADSIPAEVSSGIIAVLEAPLVEIMLEASIENIKSEENSAIVTSGLAELILPENKNIIIQSDRKLDQTNSEGVVELIGAVSEEIAGHNYDIVFQNDQKIDSSDKDEFAMINSAASDNSETFEALEMVGTVAAHTRYALSIDDGNTWKSYDGEKWITVNRENISYRGMTHDFVSSLGYFDYKKLMSERAYLHDVQVIAFLSSHYDNGKIAVKNMTVEYFNNEGAFLTDAEVLPDTIHNQYATLKARLVDVEDDSISYKVLIKPFGEAIYKSIDPLGDGWFEKKDGDIIRHSYDHKYFNVGENIIRVMLKDGRGVESSEDFNVFLDNENPWITATYDRFKMNLSIGDEDQDDVSYRVFINDIMLFDFTDYFVTPVSFSHRWKSNELILGEENTIKIEVKDIIGEVTSTSFKVTGHYNNIMFQDPLGKFYTTDLGELLQYLDFGIIVGGTVSTPAPVKVLNDTGLVLKDLTLAMERGSRHEGVSIEISSKEMPFEPMEKVEFEGVMPVHDTKEFYIRVNAHDRVDYIDDFIVSASADEADK